MWLLCEKKYKCKRTLSSQDHRWHYHDPLQLQQTCPQEMNQLMSPSQSWPQARVIPCSEQITHFIWTIIPELTLGMVLYYKWVLWRILKSSILVWHYHRYASYSPLFYYLGRALKNLKLIHTNNCTVLFLFKIFFSYDCDAPRNSDVLKIKHL